MAHLRVNIYGMKDRAAQEQIEEALQTLRGVSSAVVCLASGYLDIEYIDDVISPDRVLQTVRELGYGARMGG